MSENINDFHSTFYRSTYGEYTWCPIHQGGGGPSPQHPGDQGGARHRGDLPPQPGLQ